MSAGSAIWTYLVLGIKHIIPLGFDHILFIISLFLLSPNLKIVGIQASTFTLAHSITLGLAMYHLVNPPPAIVEPLIAASILLVALANIFRPGLHSSRVVIIFIFGLVHGLGFATVLTGLGLPENRYFLGLVMFNLGVEIGQFTIILAAYAIYLLIQARHIAYRTYVVIPTSICIAVISFYWTIQRLFF
ncbi:HupE / UreJ protein [bacterium A37T11]|nr:HupE / UreJ protein [bacterium A37T11]